MPQPAAEPAPEPAARRAAGRDAAPTAARPAAGLLGLARDPRLVTLAAGTGLLAVAAFWGFALAGASRQPGYDLTRDITSSVAGRHAVDPWLGLVAIGALAVAYLSVGHVLLHHLRQALAGLLLGAAGVATAGVAAARLDCPRGAAGCGLRNDVGAWADRIGTVSAGQSLHGPLVLVSGSLVLAALVVLALRASDRPVTRAATAVAALVSAVTPAFWLPSTQPGLGQRAWLAVVSAWLVWVCLIALTTDRPDRTA